MYYILLLILTKINYIKTVYASDRTLNTTFRYFGRHTRMSESNESEELEELNAIFGANDYKMCACESKAITWTATLPLWCRFR